MPEKAKNCPDIIKGHQVRKTIIEFEEKKHLGEKGEFRRKKTKIAMDI